MPCQRVPARLPHSTLSRCATTRQYQPLTAFGHGYNIFQCRNRIQGAQPRSIQSVRGLGLSSIAPPRRPITLPTTFVRWTSSSKKAKNQSDEVPSPSLEPSTGLLKLSATRFNEIGIQQLPLFLHKQVFPTGNPNSKADPDLVALSRDHLSKQKLLGTADDSSPPIGFELPPLLGDTLESHFYRLGQHFAGPYLRIANDYAAVQLPPQPTPDQWVIRSGWTKYLPDGTTCEVDFPDEDALTFDVETMWKINPFPIMATAASKTCWYAWLSPWYLGETRNSVQLVPLGNPAREKVIVGHNVGYDRARVREEYDLKQSRSFFLDTMSLHIAANGMCSRQRPLWMKHRKAQEERSKSFQEDAPDIDSGLETAFGMSMGMDLDGEQERWLAMSSANSLDSVAKFHCGIEVDKTIRSSLGTMTREEAVVEARSLLTYCAGDVDVTHQVFKKVLPSFLKTCPHPASFNGLRHISSVILPVNKSWENYIHNAEAVFQERQTQIQSHLISLARQAVELRQKPEIYEADPWLNQLDWSGQEIRMVKGKKKNDPPRPAARQKAPGMPKWWKDLLPTAADTEPAITTRTRITSLLMKLSWDDHPVVWSDLHGFVFRVPRTESAKKSRSGLTICSMEEEKNERLKLDTEHVFYKLPHKDGPTARCTNPLAKGYLQHFESGQMKGAEGGGREIVELSGSCSYWVSSRERIKSQVVVYKSDLEAMDAEREKKKILAKPQRGRPKKKKAEALTAAPAEPDTSPASLPVPVDPEQYGFILPQIIPMGTVTRRAVENTWLTASNAKPNRVGSELKSLVRAPPGHTFVGADVDSEELWIACLLGDAQFGLHGASALGYMTLVGSKKAGTDLHSRTAGLLGISRDAAKVFNYGRIYGAGARYATMLLRQFNPQISEQDADDTAKHLYASTKGKRTTRSALHSGQFWRGGSESVVFNMLEQFASSTQPQTPVLGAGLTEALKAKNVGKSGFLTSRINWAIQSSAVDYLHLLILSMEWLCTRYNIPARLSISIHDEIRYIAPEKYKFRIAMALQVANLWTRSLFAERVGIKDLPLCVAFFSAVDIDPVLRKEVFMDCVTPSQREPIPPGESVDIGQILEKNDSLLDDGAGESFADAIINESVSASLERAVRSIPHTETSQNETPTMKILQSKNPINRMAFVRAQLAEDDTELTEILRAARKELVEANRKLRAAGQTDLAAVNRRMSRKSGPDEGEEADIGPGKLDNAAHAELTTAAQYAGSKSATKGGSKKAGSVVPSSPDWSNLMQVWSRAEDDSASSPGVVIPAVVPIVNKTPATGKAATIASQTSVLSRSSALSTSSSSSISPLMRSSMSSLAPDLLDSPIGEMPSYVSKLYSILPGRGRAGPWN